MTDEDRRWTPARWAELVTALAALVLALAAFARFVGWVERRPGVTLPDPVLARLVPRDLTWLIFALLYASIPIAVLALSRHPRPLVRGLRAYAILVLMRMAVMAATPLDPPAGTIPLQDPLVQLLGTGQVLTRDLFFSGHTATLSLLAFTAVRPAARAFFAAAAVVVGAAVVWQAVHYTVDVLAAPVFAYAAHRLAAWPGARRAP